MKFDRLKASIANNADQSPSIYMALCMVESLLEDVEAACGKEISLCPAEDEGLPTKLVWLCRIINDIYKENDSQLQRNRARLDAAVNKLQNTQNELTELSEAAQRLAELQEEYAALERSLQQGQDMAQQCSRLEESCENARQQLQQLQDFDPVAAQAELEEVKDQIAKLETQKSDLNDRLQTARLCKEQLEMDIAQCSGQDQQLQETLNMLTAQLDSENTSAEQMKSNLEKLTLERARLNEEMNQLTLEQDEKTRELETCRQRVENFREEELLPIQLKLELARQDVEGLEQTKEQTQQELNTVSDRRNELVLEIARQKEINETTAESMKSAQSKLEILKSEKQGLDAKLSGKVQELEKLQNDVEQLKQKTYPELLEMVQQEKQRQQELDEIISQGEAQLVSLREEIVKMQQQLPQLEEAVKNDREVYDALTASCAASTTELKNLERQIGELRNNNDGEKLAIYRKQLEDKHRELEGIQTECAAILQDIKKLEQELEAGQTERDRLRELKRKHETGSEATAKQLRELETVATKEYIQEVERISQRLDMLERVRSNLSASMNKMHQILGNTPIANGTSLDAQLKSDLGRLKDCTDHLRSALVSCANSLKLEER